MAKRFIDTKLFKDSWFSNLSKDAKLLYIYLITNCDHAGIIDFNAKLIDFETEIKGSARVRQELGKCLIHLRDNYFFIVKFPNYQYKDFSEGNNNIKSSVIKRLNEFNLLDENSRVKQGLGNSSPTVMDMVKDKEKDKDKIKDKDNVNINVKAKSNNLSFVDDKFLPTIKKWLDYKKSKNQTYKNEHSLKALYNKILELSGNNADIADKIINQSMANNWAGLFELKNENKQKGENGNDFGKLPY